MRLDTAMYVLDRHYTTIDERRMLLRIVARAHAALVHSVQTGDLRAFGHMMDTRASALYIAREIAGSYASTIEELHDLTVCELERAALNPPADC